MKTQKLQSLNKIKAMPFLQFILGASDYANTNANANLGKQILCSQNLLQCLLYRCKIAYASVTVKNERLRGIGLF